MATTPLGTETDTAWDGSAASASLIAIAKKIVAATLAGLPASLGQKTAAASTSVVLASDDTAGVAIGTTADAVVAAGAAGTLSAKLRAISRDIVANIVLAAGSAIIGKVGIDQTTNGTTNKVFAATQGYTSRVSVTRTADTNAYLANDVLGPATGSTAALTFSNMGAGAGEIMITSVSFERDAAALISGETSYILYLYSITPPSALGDNAPWDLPSGDRASFLGFINLGTPVDLGSTLYVEGNSVNKQITLASSSLFGYLVTVGPYTPASSAVHVVTLHSVGV